MQTLADSSFKVEIGQIQNSEKMLTFDGGGIYFDGSTLGALYNGKPLSLLSNEKGLGMSGKEMLSFGIRIPNAERF